MRREGDALISIRPPHANAILDGAKTVELRRRIPALQPGTRLWIYATLPVGAVIGLATVDRVVRGEPENIWLEFGSRTGVTRADFDDYFRGVDVAIGLLLVDVQRSNEQVEIARLKRLRSGFHPPQVMMNLSDFEAARLRQMAFLNECR